MTFFGRLDCECDCFASAVADAAEYTEIGIRARSTTVELNSETYAAKVAIVRGASTRVDGRPWVNAPTVQRFVSFPALATDLSHLVSGWRQVGTAGASLIGSAPLVVFHTKPSWYTLDDDAWKYYPNATNTTEALLEICVGFCARAAYDSHVPAEYMQLDATPGLESCSCYAHVAGNETSIVPPSDVDALEWLGTAVRAKGKPIHIYAMHATDMSNTEYVGDLGGTLEYETLIEPGFDVSGITESAAPSEANSQLECLRRCTVAIDVALHSVRYEPDTTPNVYGKCKCYVVDAASWAYDEDWTYTPGSTVRWLRTSFCDGVAHRANDKTTSVLWSKATGSWCRGQPIGGAQRLSNSCQSNPCTDAQQRVTLRRLRAVGEHGAVRRHDAGAPGRRRVQAALREHDRLRARAGFCSDVGVAAAHPHEPAAALATRTAGSAAAARASAPTAAAACAAEQLHRVPHVAPAHRAWRGANDRRER